MHTPAILVKPYVHRSQKPNNGRKMKRDLRNSRIRSFGQWITNFYWSDVFQISDCASKFDKFVDIMSTMVDCYFPSKLTKIHYSDKPWMTPSLKFAIKKRQIAFRRHGKLLLLFNVMFEQLELSTSLIQWPN